MFISNLASIYWTIEPTCPFLALGSNILLNHSPCSISHRPPSLVPFAASGYVHYVVLGSVSPFAGPFEEYTFTIVSFGLCLGVVSGALLLNHPCPYISASYVSLSYILSNVVLYILLGWESVPGWSAYGQ